MGSSGAQGFEPTEILVRKIDGLTDDRVRGGREQIIRNELVIAFQVVTREVEGDHAVVLIGPLSDDLQDPR